MMRHITVELIAGYGLYAFAMIWLVARYGTKDRFPTTIATLVIPLLAVTAAIYTLFQAVMMKLPHVDPCPPGLEAAEHEAEKHRVRLFGGAVEEPRIAVRWAKLYESVMELQTLQVRKVASRARQFLYAS